MKSLNEVKLILEREKPKLEIGKVYKTDSHMGGSFSVKYLGKNKDGKHEFDNVTNKDFKGTKYTVEDKNLDTFILENQITEV